MTALLGWFSRHPREGSLLAGAYWIIVVLSHDLVQRPALALQYRFGIERIHYIIAALIAVSMLVLLVRLWGRLTEHPQSGAMSRSAIALLALGWVVFAWIMVRSIETIHFVQYLLLSAVLTAITRRPLTAVLLACLGGLLDEAWQYFYLHPRQPYFDFNDVVMNTTGALFGLWFYTLLRPADSMIPGVRTTLRAWAGVAILVAVLLGSGVFTVYQHEEGVALHRRVAPTEERPVNYFRTNRWGNSSVRLHPYLGLGLFLVLPLAAGAMPWPRAE